MTLPRCRTRLIATAAVLGLLTGTAPLAALDYFTVRDGERQFDLAGRVEQEAVDGGVLLLTPDGALWPLLKEGQPKQPGINTEFLTRRSDDKPFVPLSPDELARQLVAELPAGFKIHHTQNYLVCYNTSPAYAQWVGALFERLNKAFYNYWTRKGMVLSPPQFPLVALVFDSRPAYEAHAEKELGSAAGSMIGYYSLRTNRMTMYDLTGVETQAAATNRHAAARIQQILSQPGAERTVATIVHEATHQLAFNSGLQVRFADVPFWVSEGVAIFFETPDLDNSKGWRSVGAVNRVNLDNFRKYVRARPAGSLETLLCDDQRFRNPATVAEAYAEAWALNYFLLRTRSEAYVKYLQALARQAPLVSVEPTHRVRQFKDFFGDDLDALEAEFFRYMRNVN